MESSLIQDLVSSSLNRAYVQTGCFSSEKLTVSDLDVVETPMLNTPGAGN